MNVVTRGVRNAFRNVVRTVSIASILSLSIGLALAMLIANQAVGKKIKSVQSSVGNTVSITPAGVRGFDGGGTALTADELAKVESLAHIESVTKTLNDRLTSENSDLESAVEAGALGRRFIENNGQVKVPPEVQLNGGDIEGETKTFTPPVTVIGTTSLTDISGLMGGGTFTLKHGKVFDVDSTKNVAVVGLSLAEKNGLTVGSTFTAYDTAITVVGIYDSGSTFGNNQVLMPLVSVQNLSDQKGSITGAIATVDSVTNIDSATTSIKNTLGDAADVTNQADRAKEVIAPLQNIQSISLYSLIGAVIAGAVIILMTMVMIVRERRREIGVIKAIGASNRSIVGQFMVEAVTLTGLAAIVGVVIGAIAGSPITKMLVDGSTDGSDTDTIGRGGPGVRMAFGGIRDGVTNITANVGWDIILYGLGAALVIAIIGSAIAAFFIAKIGPSEALRTD